MAFFAKERDYINEKKKKLALKPKTGLFSKQAK
jgi:hypothetical protein